MVHSKLIAAKNDEYRRTFSNCRVVLTASVSFSVHREKILQAVQSFQDFRRENDPYGEHDCGELSVEGTIYFFKIEYYDENYQFFKQDGHRVITIMRADEY